MRGYPDQQHSDILKGALAVAAGGLLTTAAVLMEALLPELGIPFAILYGII